MKPNIMKNRTSLIAIACAVLLMGAGCAGTDPFEGMETSVNALREAKVLSSGQDASARRISDSMENELPVAFVLSGGNEPDTVSYDRLGGEFGCGDKIAFSRISRESASSEIVRDALETLLSVHDSSFDGLYNSLWQSDLQIEKIQSRDAVTTEVWLKGNIVSGGACDTPRIKEQIEATVRQYRPQFMIYLNGEEKNWRCFGDASGTCT